MFNVMTRACDQCLLTDKRIVSGARAAQIIRDCQRKDAHFICHKSPSGQEIACRGYYDLYGGQMARIAERLGMVREVDPDAIAAAAGTAETACPAPGEAPQSGGEAASPNLTGDPT